MTLTCSRAALEARKSKEQCFQISKEKKNDSQLRILYSAKLSLKCKRQIKTFSEIQGLKNSHLFPRVPHQNKNETKHPGSKGWEPSGEGEGRPKMPGPEQNLLLDTERGTGGQRRAEGSLEKRKA